MSRLKTELTKLIEAEMERALAILTNTGAIKSMDDYKYHVGGLDKLKLVLELMEDAETKAEER